MPMHDWNRVDAEVYHHFHHEWISEICRFLNRCLLPADLYAVAEQVAAGFGPDVLTLQDSSVDAGAAEVTTATQTRPNTSFYAELPGEFKRRRKSLVAVRHISGDRIVAMIEVVSPGNKSNANAFRAFVHKACELIEQQVHLLLLDPLPPGRRDPNGIHAAIWEQLADEPFELPVGKPLTLVAYESGLTTGAYIEAISIGDPLPNMPLFLAPGQHILVPLEETYRAAWDAVPTRWQRVIDPAV